MHNPHAAGNKKCITHWTEQLNMRGAEKQTVVPPSDKVNRPVTGIVHVISKRAALHVVMYQA